MKEWTHKLIHEQNSVHDVIYSCVWSLLQESCTSLLPCPSGMGKEGCGQIMEGEERRKREGGRKHTSLRAMRCCVLSGPAGRSDLKPQW